MVYLGIDVGKSGALARISDTGEMSVEPTPVRDGEYDISAMGTLVLDSLNGDQNVFCMIERAQAMPGQGVVSMFEFGKGYGIWLAVLALNDIPHQIVHSRTWTKELLMGAPGEGKERNIAAAQRFFPKWKPVLKKELLYCDAILLAEYARRKGKSGDS